MGFIKFKNHDGKTVFINVEKISLVMEMYGEDYKDCTLVQFADSNDCYLPVQGSIDEVIGKIRSSLRKQ